MMVSGSTGRTVGSLRLPTVTSVRGAALPAWRTASSPLRALRDRLDRIRHDCPISVLFYHRVADRDVTPWTMTNAEFAAQIDFLAARYEVISLAEAQRRLITGRSERPAVVLTFDDGYRENLDAAIPLLLQRQLPFTYFVTTGHVASGQPFPHDVALGHRFPVHTVDEIQALHRAGVDLGVHTRTHADLGAISDPAAIRSEVVGATRDLVDWLGRDWLAAGRYFAFPFGQRANLSTTAAMLARQAGLAGVVSAYGGINRRATTDGFHMLRFHGDRSLPRVANWLADDPRWWGVRAEMREQMTNGSRTDTAQTDAYDGTMNR